MFSPYEELEYLSDYLPEEGEKILITRQSGELVCRPVGADDLRDGIDDSDLYGQLVQANERLHTAGTFPLWATLMSIVWLAILLHGVAGLGWKHWFVVPGLALPMLYGGFHWIRYRQLLCFRNEVLPSLRQELSIRSISRYSLIAGVRQHGELRTLLDELVRWSPEPAERKRETPQ